MVARTARWVAIAAAVIGYPVLAHYTNQSEGNSRLGAVVALAPIILAAVILAWRSSQRWSLLGLIALCCGGLWLIWPKLESHYGALYWIQHVGMQLILFVVFGRTLIGNREALCTRFARLVHAPMILAPAHHRYTRWVTLAWTIYFAVIAITSTILFFFTPLATWSFFANFLTFPLVILMFVVEYRIRRWVLPHMPPAHILDGLRAFMKSDEQPRQQ